MLNAFLTLLRKGFSYFTPRPDKAATDEARRNDVLATPPGCSSAVTFNLHRPPPDNGSPPVFSRSGSVSTSTTTRPNARWRYDANSKAGRVGRDDLMATITARAATHGYLNLELASFKKMMDVLEAPLKQKDIWHLFDVPKKGTGHIWPNLDPQDFMIELSDYGNIFYDHTVTLEHVMAYVNFGAGAGSLVLPSDTSLPYQRSKPDLGATGPHGKLAVVLYDIQWTSDFLTDILVIIFGQDAIQAMKYDIPNVNSISAQDPVERIEGFIVLRKILSIIRPSKRANVTQLVSNFNAVSIKDTNPENLHQLIGIINC